MLTKESPLRILPRPHLPYRIDTRSLAPEVSTVLQTSICHVTTRSRDSFMKLQDISTSHLTSTTRSSHTQSTAWIIGPVTFYAYLYRRRDRNSLDISPTTFSVVPYIATDTLIDHVLLGSGTTLSDQIATVSKRFTRPFIH